MRLIDADALKADDEINRWWAGKTLELYHELIIKKIDDAPTVKERPTDKIIAVDFMPNGIIILTDINNNKYIADTCKLDNIKMKGEDDGR